MTISNFLPRPTSHLPRCCMPPRFRSHRAVPDSAAEGSAGTTDQTAAELTAEQIEKPLIDDVSADVAPTVQEFIEEAAAANREEAEVLAEEPVSAAEESAMRAGGALEGVAMAAEEVAPYISFEACEQVVRGPGGAEGCELLCEAWARRCASWGEAGWASRCRCRF